MTYRLVAHPVWAVLLLMSTLAAQAQSPVYRCGPGGREYSSTPCPGGKPVIVDDTRTLDQQRQAGEAAQRDAKLADKLAAERRQRGAAAKPLGAVRIGPAPAASVPSKIASRPGHGKKPKKKHGKPVDPSLSEPVRVPAKTSH